MWSPELFRRAVISNKNWLGHHNQSNPCQHRKQVQNDDVDLVVNTNDDDNDCDSNDCCNGNNNNYTCSLSF